jgi:hypothetical protein
MVLGRLRRRRFLPAASPTTPTDQPCGDTHPCFNAWIYGADVVLPIIDFGQDSTWRPNDTATHGHTWVLARWIFIVIGWLLASVFVATFTGLIQRP